MSAHIRADKAHFPKVDPILNSHKFSMLVRASLVNSDFICLFWSACACVFVAQCVGMGCCMCDCLLFALPLQWPGTSDVMDRRAGKHSFYCESKCVYLTLLVTSLSDAENLHIVKYFEDAFQRNHIHT